MISINPAKMRTLVFLLLFPLFFLSANAQKLAFPTAEGFGRFTTGGRGGKVLIVDNLNDSGPGSLREAVNYSGKRTVVFNVSGNIQLESPLTIIHGNLTLAGHSAPGDGICIRNYPVIIKADNIMIRYLRIRLGDSKSFDGDAITCIRNKNIMIDHCSLSWGVDETASIYDNENTTVQWSIISESLMSSINPKALGFGGIWGGKNASFTYNLFANNNARTPRLNGKRYSSGPDRELVDFSNNVIYNWGGNAIYGGENGEYTIIGNYFKPGPATKGKYLSRIINPSPPYGKFYIDGNQIEGQSKINKDNWTGSSPWSGGIVLAGDKKSIRLLSNTVSQSVAKYTAKKTYQQVLQHVGCSFQRDSIDLRIINEVNNGSATYGNGLIRSQNDVGGWVELATYNQIEDLDCDGIADSWEKQNGLDPNNPDDSIEIRDDSGYSFLEIYLEELVSHTQKK